jgi:hypothetical protein
MKLRRPFILFIQCILAVPLLLGAAEAKPTPCRDLLNPLHSQVNVIKDRGGLWTQFEKKTRLQGNSPLALKVDSKILGLMFTLDYLCTTREGIPYSDIAEYVVRGVKEDGREGFIAKHVDLGHSLKEVTEWADFAIFSEGNLTRKLDLGQIKKTVDQANSLVARYKPLFKSKASAEEVLAEAKSLIKDIEQLHATDLYLKLADHENNAIPHSSALSNAGDAM